MIKVVKGFKNKYAIEEPVTPIELKDCLIYYLNRHNFKGIICNSETVKKIHAKPGEKFITINNKVEDNVFYVNRIG